MRTYPEYTSPDSSGIVEYRVNKRTEYSDNEEATEYDTLYASDSPREALEWARENFPGQVGSMIESGFDNVEGDFQVYLDVSVYERDATDPEERVYWFVGDIH
jgi:hypothetical protein